MILRRLSKGLAERNWSTVALEVLIVVVGILIGLQVDGWTETRKDRRDEQLFLARLHDDVTLAEQLSSRVRDRRLALLQSTIDAGNVLFDRVERASLTDEECNAIISFNFFNITASSLPALSELAGTGRMGIIQDAELRTALVELQQTWAALVTMITVQTSSSAFTNLPSDFPDLIQLESYLDTELDEIRVREQCDLAKMRADQSFLNRFSVNADGYDAYIRDGLAPWSAQFDLVHQLVDHALAISH